MSWQIPRSHFTVDSIRPRRTKLKLANFVLSNVDLKPQHFTSVCVCCVPTLFVNSSHMQTLIHGAEQAKMSKRPENPK